MVPAYVSYINGLKYSLTNEHFRVSRQNNHGIYEHKE